MALKIVLTRSGLIALNFVVERLHAVGLFPESKVERQHYEGYGRHIAENAENNRSFFHGAQGMNIRGIYQDGDMTC